MKRKRISRRTILRGLGGVGLALPSLQIMGGGDGVSAQDAMQPPSRFLVSYAGMSYGKPSSDRAVPTTPGTGYEVTRGLAPIGDGSPIDGFSVSESFDIQDQVSVVSRMLIPYNMDADGPVPSGGRGANFHGTSPGLVQLNGMRRDDRGSVDGATADQIVADAICPDKPVLAYRLEPHSYRGYEGPINGFLSWRRDGDASEAQRVEPIASPRAAYESMLSGWVPTDPAIAAAARARLARRTSALDLVSDGRRRLLSIVGRDDRVRLEQHFEEVHELEQRIASIEVEEVAACQDLYSSLGNPGSDPEQTGAYSNEDERARVFSDLIRIALVCDSRRSVSMMYSHLSQAQMDVRQTPGWPGMETATSGANVHSLTHASNPPEAPADGLAWYVRHFARLADLLRRSTESDGTSVLDHTAMIMVLEGGRGWSPFENRDSVHSTENMMVLVAGGAELGLKTGHHIVAQDKHPAQVVISAMQAVGVETDQLGEVHGALPEMFA